MPADRDCADSKLRRAFEECRDALYLLVERPALRGCELIERLDCEMQLSAGAALMPDSGGDPIDQQHWKVPGLPTWGKRALRRMAGEQ